MDNGNGSGTGSRGRAVRRRPVARKFGAVDALFGEAIEVQRSLYFTMSAKTFYVQSDRTTINTNQIGHVRLDLDSGEALSTLDFGERVSVSGEVALQADAQLEVFRRGVEKLFNRKRKGIGGSRSVRQGQKRRSRGVAIGDVTGESGKGDVVPKIVDLAGEESRVSGEEVVKTGTLTSKSGDFVVSGDLSVNEFVTMGEKEWERAQAKRERDAAQKREKRALARAHKAIKGEVLALSDDERAIYGDGDEREAEWNGSEGPVAEGALE